MLLGITGEQRPGFGLRDPCHWAGEQHAYWSVTQEVSGTSRWSSFQEAMRPPSEAGLPEIVCSGMLYPKTCGHSLLWLVVPFAEAQDLILSPFFEAEYLKQVKYPGALKASTFSCPGAGVGVLAFS